MQPVILRYLISILLLLASIVAFSQKTQKEDTVKHKFLPSGIRFGTDVISIIRTQTNNSFAGYEFSADVDLYRYYVTVEAGGWERKFSSNTDDYANKGNYMRAGVDVNFLKKDPDKNMFFLGARYGWGTFSENLNVVTDDPIWGFNESNYANVNSKARWLELTTGLRVKIWKTFWMGYTGRYKFGLRTKQTTDLLPHDVPGYGLTDRGSTWGFNYQILFRIPIRKSQ